MPRARHRSLSALALCVGCTGASPAADTGEVGSTHGTAPVGSTSGTSGTAGVGSTTFTGTTGVETTSGGQPVQCETGGWSSHGQDGPEDSGFGMGDDMPLPLTIYEIQQGNAPDNTRVTLTNVVVTTPTASSESLPGSELFVQELEGGPYSGLRIHASGFDPGAAITVGQTADITGTIIANGPYFLLSIESDDEIVLTGTAALPEPVVVSTGDLQPEDPDARAYEGVSVLVQMATVTANAACNGEFILDDAVRVDDRFMPDALVDPPPGQVFESVRGVLIYASDSYELAPPDPSAIQ